jgi:hypothetical protein
MTIAAISAPPMPFIPSEWIGKRVFGMILVWAGDAETGERAIAPIRALGSPVAQLIRPMPYLALQTMLDASAPHGRHYYWKSHRVAALSDDVISLIVDAMERSTSPFSQIAGWAMGGAVSRVDASATAVGEREIGFDINVTAAWSPADPEPERHIRWVRDAWDAIRPASVGVYVNFLSDEGATGVDAAYGSRMARLTALKDRYDPTNVFRLNANIPPSRRP